MRFKTGEKVEVMNNKEVNSFSMGDIVEVFHQRSWKTAIVLNVLGGTKESKKDKIRYKISTFKNRYLVRLLGCSKELAIGRSNIRTRQTRHDVNRVPVETIPLVGDDVIVSKPSPSICSQKKYLPIEDSGNTQYDAAQRESVLISSRSLKRMPPYVSSVAEGHVKKFRAAGKEGWIVADRLLGKVDAVAYPNETLGEKYMHASYKIMSNGHNHQMERERQNDILGYSGVRGSELNSSESDACSVGSCSVTNDGLKNYNYHFRDVQCQETDTICSDAESSYGSGSERRSSSLPLKEEVEVYSWRHASFASNGLKMPLRFMSSEAGPSPSTTPSPRRCKSRNASSHSSRPAPKLRRRPPHARLDPRSPYPPPSSSTGRSTARPSTRGSS